MIFTKGSELDKQIYKEGDSSWGLKSGFLDVEDVKHFIMDFETELGKGLMEDLKDKPQEAFAIGNWISDLIRRLAGDVLVGTGEQ